MRRREFIVLVGGAAVWPLAARAQQAERVRRIGVLIPYAESDEDAYARFNVLRNGIQQFGWIEGRNVSIDVRWAPDLEAIQRLAKELVALAPDVIVVQSNPGVVSLRQVNRTIPLVFVQVGDPVGSGFVDSLSRPGGNITGFTTSEPTVGGKWLGLLKEITPDMRQAVVIFDPKIVTNLAYLQAAEAAGSVEKITVSAAAVRDPADIERAVAAVASERNVGLIVLPSPVTGNHRELIAEIAMRHRLPSIGAFRYLAASGCLISYGPDTTDIFRRAASYVDRILRGEVPADLPVQQPTKFELVINLKTAKALGLTVPQTLLARADEVIE
jgi:putative tryptophan/tyrosine transport system substrate-binding protein